MGKIRAVRGPWEDMVHFVDQVAGRRHIGFGCDFAGIAAAAVTLLNRLPSFLA
jgi:microsomal dipeptidase-like Zn-dependent dipeptidase